MLIKALFLILLAYLAMRAVRSLVRAAFLDGQPPRRVDDRRAGPRRDGPRQAPEARSAAGKYRVEVEDARWEDVDDRR